MKTKIKKSLKSKLVGIIVALSVSICVASCLVGYYRFRNTIQELYSQNGYVVGDIILNNIDHDKIAEYTRTWQPDEYYPVIQSYLKGVEEASGAAYIYIVVPNADKTMTYVYDSSGLSMGDKDSISVDLDKIMDCYHTGVRPTDYFVRHSARYGYLTSSVLPIEDSGGNTVALLFVDTYMELIVSTLRAYVLWALLISAVIMAAFCVIAWIFVHKSILEPVKNIEESAQEFAKNGAQITEDLNRVKTGDELQVLAESVVSMEHSIIQYIYDVQKVTAEKERIGAELNVATDIQANMLPNIFPAFPEKPEIDIFASMTPAKEVGGDLYDFFLIDDDHMGLVIGDVSGKGVPAALFMVISKTVIKNQTLSEGQLPNEILARVNDQLCEGNEANMFCTAWLGILDLRTGHVVSSNAGHEFPVLMHANGNYELLKDPHGLPLAAMEGARYKNFEFDMEPGSRLFVYTDGVAEATNSKNEPYDTGRMLATLNESREVNIEQQLVKIKESIEGFVKGAPQFDDITMLCIEYKGRKSAAEEI